MSKKKLECKAALFATHGTDLPPTSACPTFCAKICHLRPPYPPPLALSLLKRPNSLASPSLSVSISIPAFNGRAA